MEVNTLNDNQFVDLFGDGTQTDPDKLKFSGEFKDTNLFDKDKNSEPEPDSNIDKDQNPDPDKVDDVDPTLSTDPDKNVDILGDGKKGPGRPAKNDFKDITGYFEDRIKNGKFVPIEEDLEDGTKAIFIPRTPEEFDEVLDIQVQHGIQKATETLEQKWYQSKSPAWQAVAKYAEMTDDPSEILPFIQGVKTIDSVSDLDEKTPEGAEKIIRTRLSQRGDADDIIDDQIESLKTTNKLISTAEKYKPLIIKEEQKYLTEMINQKKQEDQNYQELVTDIRAKAIQAIETPLFGKKLKTEEKSAIFELIGQPNVQTKGYQIYTAIDNLFESGNFETLKKIALLIAKEDALVSYISTGAANKAAEGIQRKLRVAADRTRSTNDPDTNEPIQPINRNQFAQPRFGR